MILLRPLSVLLRVASLAATLVLLASFGLYAVSQTSNITHAAQANLTQGPGTSGPAGNSPSGRDWYHRQIDTINDELMAPFQAVVPGSSDSWMFRIVNVLLGLALYMVLLGWVARSLGLSNRTRRRNPKPKSKQPDPAPPNSWAGSSF